ncbi:hypothetical protein EYF80_057879 [Liparis tanakae]|uniref:Uncharacterized protein n=1 Tax=Liparis tanakae TaxID=230148 RepID=A0A4Z2ETQ4_9TELE|nr:hypothetical protein EYF80_057879 [Liparis tanakae]
MDLDPWIWTRTHGSGPGPMNLDQSYWGDQTGTFYQLLREDRVQHAAEDGHEAVQRLLVSGLLSEGHSDPPLPLPGVQQLSGDERAAGRPSRAACGGA